MVKVVQFNKETLEKEEFDPRYSKGSWKHNYCENCGKEMLLRIDATGMFSTYTGNEIGNVVSFCDCGNEKEVIKVYKFEGEWWLSNFEDIDKGAEKYYQKYLRKK